MASNKAAENSAHICPECGAEMTYTEGPLVETIRGHTYELSSACRWECLECHEYIMSAEEADRTSKELWKRVRRDEGILFAGEVRALRKGLGLTQVEFGKVVCADGPTVSRWENGHVVQDARANRLMIVLRDCPQAVPVLMRAAGLAGDLVPMEGVGAEAAGVPETADEIADRAFEVLGTAGKTGRQLAPAVGHRTARRLCPVQPGTANRHGSGSAALGVTATH